MSSWKQIGETEERIVIEVTHSCGHTQVCSPRKKLLELGEERFPGHKERQYGWLSRNLCPGCFSVVKEVNPNFKTVD